MRTFLIGMCLLISGIHVSAQITITSADMPQSGNMILTSSVTDQWNIDPTVTGPNQVWDFSFLTPDFQDVDTFYSVSSTPLAYQFFFNNSILYPDYFSQHALKPIPNGGGGPGGGPVSIEDAYNYFKVESGAYIQTGFGASINNVPTSQQYSDRDFIYRFPMEYGNSDSGFASFLISIPTLGTFGQDINRVNEVDGWGTLITPFGSFQTLRVKTTLNITDTIFVAQFGFGSTFVRDEAYEYKWLALGGGTPMMQIDDFGGGGGPGANPLNITYQDSVRIITGGPDPGLDQLTIFPNPMQDHLVIELQGKSLNGFKPGLYNLEGRRMKVDFTTQGNRIKMDRGQLANGVYFLHLTSPDQVGYVEKILVE